MTFFWFFYANLYFKTVEILYSLLESNICPNTCSILDESLKNSYKYKIYKFSYNPGLLKYK